MAKLGLYVHIPFCDQKCPYCDFYSMRGTEPLFDSYTEELLRQINAYKTQPHPKADTLYFGGGTPSVLGGERIAALVQAAKTVFGLEQAEITAEANPGTDLSPFLRAFRKAGGNRISLGLQSANEEELSLLGRRHTAQQAKDSVLAAQQEGFTNISLDLMLGIQHQTAQSLHNSIAFCTSLPITHLSAYLLKIEERTAYYAKKDTLTLPNEDETCAFYLQTCQELEQNGFHQYEISNFAKPGFAGRHNLKYWHCEEYLGFGPAAHSFYQGKRFYWPRDIKAFLSGAESVQDGEGGSFEEYAMLALRLNEGLTEAACLARFGTNIPEQMRKAAAHYTSAGFLHNDAAGIRLTPKGFLVSNTLLAELLY